MSEPQPTPTSQYVAVEDRDGVRWLSLRRPRAKNALNTEMYEALTAAIQGAGADGQLRAVVIPVLAERANALGVTPEAGLDACHDAVRVCVSLAGAVRSAEGDEQLLPYTDTVEFNAFDPDADPR